MLRAQLSTQSWGEISYKHPVLNKQAGLFKGCVCYGFASLFCMSKREHLRNEEKCFLFHLKSFFINSLHCFI